MARLFEKFAVLETNHVSAVRTGDIKAQYPVAGGADLENGMLLVVDDVAKEVKFSVDGTEKNIYLHASEERIYDPILGRNSFVLKGANQVPKMLKLQQGDIFETNAVDGGDYASLAAVQTALSTKAVYGIAGDDGLIVLKSDILAVADYEVLLQVVEVVSLPNGTDGFKFSVVKA